MTTPATKKMIRAYFERRKVGGFLRKLFQTPPENYHKSEKVEWEIERDDEDVAVTIKDYTTGYHNNSDDRYTAKELKPPAYKESFSLNVFDEMKKPIEKTVYDDPDFQANTTVKAFRKFRKIEDMINRGIEIQCAQVLTTGVLDLKDKNAINTIT